MISFEQLAHYWETYHGAVIEHYQDEVRNALLNHLYLFRSEGLLDIACELSEELRLPVAEALAVLRPVAIAMYEGAKCSNLAHGRDLPTQGNKGGALHHTVATAVTGAKTLEQECACTKLSATELAHGDA